MIERTWLDVREAGGASRSLVFEENGSPASMQMTGLQSYSNYEASAGCYSDGLQCLALQSVAFQTLRASSGSVVFNAYRRQPDGSHTIIYDYTSLYAVSSAILHVDGPVGFTPVNVQGTVDFNNGQLVFNTDALDCCGAQYLVYAQFHDIYGVLFQSGSTTITTSTLNVLTMSYASRTTSSVTFDLDYWVDSGFASGWLDYWNDGDDPTQVQPQGHFHFFDGDTSVTANGLDENTTYIFRATIVLDDGNNTEIYSAYLTQATAEPDWSRQPFQVTNLRNGNNFLNVMVHASSNEHPDLQYGYAGQDGVPQVWYDPVWQTNPGTQTGYGTTIAMNEGETLFLRGNNPNGLSGDNTDKYVELFCSYNFEVKGNVMSLLSRTGFTTMTSIPNCGLNRLFYNKSTLVDCSDMSFGAVTTVGSYGLYRMFYNDNITTPPDMSAIERINDSGCYEMFYSCDNLAEPADLSSLSVFGAQCLRNMYMDCVSLSYPSQLPSARRIDGRNVMQSTYMRCTSLRVPVDLSKVTAMGNYSLTTTYSGCTNLNTASYPNFTYDPVNQAGGWLSGCAATGTIYVPSEAVHDAIVGTSVVPSGWSVVVQAQ